MSADRPIPCVLTIAGSDSGGGAGIQADLKAFARCGVHGACAITAVTAQNTLGVEAVHAIPPAVIVAQVRAVSTDLGVQAVKVGMVGSAEAAVAVAEALDELEPGTPVVLDPVMVAESGARLLDAGAESALVELLLPRATVTTPNVPEARVLARAAQATPTGGTAASSADSGATPGPRAAAVVDDGDHEGDGAARLARLVHGLGPANVVVTGGHREQLIDLFYDGSTFTQIPGERHPDGAAHGSGCTHSAALAAGLALGAPALDAARMAREIASGAVRDGLRHLGRGAGPVDVIGLCGPAMVAAAPRPADP